MSVPTISEALLIGALLENIEAHAVEADFDEFHDRFTPEQIATFAAHRVTLSHMSSSRHLPKDVTQRNPSIALDLESTRLVGGRH
jgi:hypothetical protein